MVKRMVMTSTKMPAPPGGGGSAAASVARRDVWENVRRQDRDRFLAALFAPPAEREALLLLYGFHLEIARTREVARELLLGRIRLHWWRQGVAAVYGDRDSPTGLDDHPLLAPLAAAVAGYGLERAHFDALIDSRDADLESEPAPPADLPALEAWIAATALPLAALSWQVLGGTGNQVLGGAGNRSAAALSLPPAVHHATLAWSLTGAARATPFLARQQRTLLPASLLRQHGVTLSALYAGQPGPGLAAAVAEVLAAATWHHQRCRVAVASLDRAAFRRLRPLLLPAALAAHDGRVLRRIGYDPFHPRALHSGVGRLLALLAAVARGRRL